MSTMIISYANLVPAGSEYAVDGPDVFLRIGEVSVDNGIAFEDSSDLIHCPEYIPEVP